MGTTVAHTAVRILIEARVRRVYAVVGESFLELLDALRREREVALVSARHDSGAAFMAEAEGKLTDRPAVLLASRGPSATGLVLGVQTAYQDETPMVVLLETPALDPVLTGEVPATDLTSTFEPISKWCVRAEDPDDVPHLLAEGLARCREGRPGPVVIGVPSDAWGVPYDSAKPAATVRPPATGTLGRSAEAVAALVDEARYPVVIVGGRARSAREELIAVADELSLPVYNAFRRQDAFPENHERYAGHLGLGIPARQLDALERADLVLALGTQLDEVTTQGYRYPTAQQTLVLVGTGMEEQRRRGLTFRVDSEVEPFLRELRSIASPRTRRASAANAAVHTFMTPPDTSGESRVHPADVVRVLRKLAPEDTVVTSDAGNFAQFMHRYWCFTEPRSQLGPSNAAMGYAVPAAVAAKLAEPRRAVVAMVGDAGTLMTGQEIETAVRYRAPVMVVVFQNGLHGPLAVHQARTHGRLSGVTVPIVDFASWARGLGAAGYTVDDRHQLEPIVASALVRQRPCVIDVRTDPDVVTPDVRLSTLLGAVRPPAS
ncbi:thiamine pyrophosphate-binding protein [Amycolatopsis jiangsuensis]|uniref:Acetolactate synthase-1/2/3 large subunit n=1 Tax=Amycolatopsis jiangsuensis TaxID=1181879 RepID=A0A840IVF7_9PSEU|nr:thiamine pyrophosphate-dependent enzyme [Amycolatopsis jiangsuensis]MBB4686721.1 acetolactate synthase-1/2/3 large subunit [Amycolatopsis jiangsuensis]